MPHLPASSGPFYRNVHAVDYDVGPRGPTIDTHDTDAFPETPGAFFWSATELMVPTPAVMFVDFGYGHATNYAVAPTSQVRCVR